MSVPLQVRVPSVSLTGDRTLREAGWLSIARAVSTWPMPVRVGLLLGSVAAVGWVDFLTGFEVSVSFLYLLPIALGTRVAGRSVGNLVALVSAGAWLGADLLAGHTYGHWLIPLWDTLMFASTLLVVVALLASLREANEGLEQTVSRRTQSLQAENAQRRRAEEDLRQALGDVRKAQAELRRTQFQLIEAAKMESAARLRADPLLRDTPIVFLTALVSNEETDSHEKSKGAETFLAKPADLGELKKTLEEHLRG